MFQNNFRWYKIIDTKWLVKIGLHFLKEKNVNLYLLKRQVTNVRDLRKWKHLCSSGRIQERSAWHLGTAFQAILSLSHQASHPYSSLFFHGSNMGCVSPVTAKGLLSFTTYLLQEIPQQSMTTLKRKLTEGNLGEQERKKKEGKWWGFRITFTSNQTNQMETMKFYLGPIKQAVIQIKYTLHTDNEDAEKEQPLTWPVEGWLALTFLVPFFKYTSSLTQQFHF